MNRILSILNFAFILACTTPGIAMADTTTIGLGIKLMPTKWSGENKPSGTDFDSEDGGQLGLSAMLQTGRFYAGVNFQGGEYDFSGGAPDLVLDDMVVAVSEATVERNEFDLLFGYYFWPRVSLFLDLKAINSKWKTLDYKTEFGGIGFGATGFIPLNQNWVMHGTIGIVPAGNVEVNGANKGDGNSGAIEFGAVYSINAHNRMNFGIKLQSQTYEFDDGTEQSHQLNGLYLGYNYLFKI